jgi:hypothetical protein
MQELLRWLASWKGVSVEKGAELQFEFSRFPGGGLALLVLLGLVLLLVFAAFVYRRDGKNLRPWQRVVLASLRCLALLAAATLLLEPNLVAVKRETRPGHTILLLDVSQSMNHLDAFRREAVQPLAQGWRDIGVPDPAAVSRFELAKALLAVRDGELVRKLAAKNQVQLYGFGSGLEDLPVVAAPAQASGPTESPQQPVVGPPPPPKLDLPRLQATGRATNLGGALRTALDKSRNSEIAAVVVISDGRRNIGPQGAELARLINQRKVPHTLVLGTGDPSETQTVEITRFDAPEKVFQRDPFEMRANLLAQGYDGLTLTVRLVRADQKGAETVVRTQQVAVAGGHSEVQVEWKELTADEPGRFVYRAEVEPPSGEPPAPERHRKDAAVEVLGERTRVLLLSGSANHEYQFLRNLLIRDKTIDVSCWLQSADSNFPQDGDPEVRIDKLPESRKDLDPYDAVILIDPNPDKLPATFAANLREQVRENGTGLWWVSGYMFTLAALRTGAATRPLAELLPVLPDMDRAEQMFELGQAFKTPWSWKLTPEGADGMGAKITRITDSRDESALLWGRLPVFYFWFPVLRPKPAATVLLEHPSPELQRENKGMPLAAAQLMGAGRVLYSGTDETYRWRSTYEDAYNRFWVNGIRFLFAGRITAGNSRFRLLPGAEKLELGEPIRLQVEARDEAMNPLNTESVELAVEREGQAVETIRLLPVESVPGSYEIQYRPTQTGTYRVHSTPQVGGKEVEARFQVVPAQIEREGPMDRAELASIAACNGGRLCDTADQLLRALDEVPSRSATDTFRTPHALWDGWTTVTFILAVLALEWLLRKRFNLL